MRAVIAGAEITSAMVDVIETLQTGPSVVKSYLSLIEELAAKLCQGISTTDKEHDDVIFRKLHTLQLLRRDILTLSNPPDLNDPSNDIPAVQL